MDDTPSKIASNNQDRSPQLGHSTQSSTSLASGSTLLDDQDEDVRIAVKALGDMRNGGINKRFAVTSPTPALSISSSSIPATSLPSPTQSNSFDLQPESDFVSRMAHIPLVNGALRMYEQGKASSRVVKYGAEIMESGVKTISRPVIDRLPTGQLDDFACRQLDRLDKYRRPLQSPSDRQDPEGTSKDPRMYFGSGDSAGRKDVRERGEDVDEWVRSASSHAPRSPSRSQGSLSPRSSTPKRASDSQDLFDADVDLAHPADVHRGLSPPSYRQESAQDNRNQQVVPRTRIHNFLVEAGGLGIALSEESMRKLRYVLQWLQYATNRIDQQILAIRDFTESLQQNYFYPPVTTSTPGGSMHHHSRSSSGSFSSESQAQAISSAHMRKLTSLRRDVVQTVRQVVNIVSKHGGGAALPEPAQNAMKGFILKLPKRVKEAMRMGGPPSDTSAGMGAAAATAGASTNIGGVNGNEKDNITAAASGRARSERRSGASRRTRLDRGVGGSLSATQSPASSTTNSPAHSPRMFSSRSLRSFTDDDQSSSSSSRHAASQQTMSAGMAVVAAQRILTLATESLDMMHGVTGIVKDSLDRADAWVEKLKIVGIQRGNGPSESQPVTSLDSGSDNHGLDLPPSALPDGDQDSDSALLSPLSMSLSLGRSRRGSIGNNLGSSVPSTPGFSGYPGLYQSSGNTPFYDTHVLPVDAPSPEVGLGMRRMSIRGDDDIIKKELEEAKMEVDEVTFE